MISVVGGTYDEFCQFPPWRQNFGSAGRAAAAIATLGESVRLHTFCSPEAVGQREAMASLYGYELAATTAAPEVAFDYFHALTPVQVTPSIYPLYDATRVMSVDAELALRFGVVEGETKLNARRVVYDPQSPLDPAPYHRNGSAAQELALVCNLPEARLLSGQEEPADCAVALLAQGTDVVVIKAGAFGALIATAQSRTWVPAYWSESVFPIGSGDVFSAVFAAGWLAGKRPDDAADTASRATALYCASRSLPDRSRLALDGGKLQAFKPTRLPDRPPCVYLAGPFFTMGQLWLVEEARTELRAAGLTVFSPFHDVGLISSSTEIASRDLEGLEKCDLVFALIDTLDPGTLFEIGYAHKAGKPVVGFAQSVGAGDLTMFEGAGAIVESDFATAIYQAAWTGWAAP